MTFTYSGLDLSTELAQIRLEIGDTVNQSYSLTDEEIAFAQTQSDSVLGTALICAGWRLTRLSDYIAQSGGGSNTQTNQKFEQFKQVYESLQKRVVMGGQTTSGSGAPCFGGISRSRMDLANSDTDFPKPAFAVGMDDDPTNSQTDVDGDDD